MIDNILMDAMEKAIALATGEECSSLIDEAAADCGDDSGQFVHVVVQEAATQLSRHSPAYICRILEESTWFLEQGLSMLAEDGYSFCTNLKECFEATLADYLNTRLLAGMDLVEGIEGEG
jgi:uncharacterized protein (DUF1778 family)